ncbi:MAG: DUF1566 domain-containing protein [Anaerolineales bacterium]
MNSKTLRITILSIIFTLAASACTGAIAEALDIDQPSTLSVGGVSTSQPVIDDTAPVSIGSTYPNLDTGQVACYDDRRAIPCPEEGEDFYGQDAQYSSSQFNYVDNGDGTVTDLNTGLMWVQDPGDKLYYDEAIALAGSYSFAGYDDWRVPTIKELYSLMDFSGVDDAVTGTDPFIDTDYFIFEYGDPSTGEREIDSQWVTSSIYTSSVMGGQECFFGVNFADGRIKCYPTGDERMSKLYFLRLVRSGEGYGENQFIDNDNGTVIDQSTGLVWQQGDSGEGMGWGDALNYCESLTLAGQDDWRLPNAKELQYIVDYERGPDASNSAAIDPIFSASSIVNEAGQTDYPFYWTSTTHADTRGGQNAAYIAFGRALGYFNNTWMDVHGAGAQRSDPKAGDPDDYPTSMGPQGDVRRLTNYVRCVRGGVSGETLTGGEVTSNQSSGFPTAGQSLEQQGRAPQIDFTSAAAQLGVSEQALREALGDPSQGPPDFQAAAATLGVSVQNLIDSLGLPHGGSGQGGLPPNNQP